MTNHPHWNNSLMFSCLSAAATAILACGLLTAASESPSVEVKQITSGPNHHFFGYIGHAGTIPWNQSGRYIVALETGFQDHMPKPDEAAKVILLDAQYDFAVRIIDQTCAWNPQQGTMLYWNPLAPETQFFFNDRDPKTGKVFCVLFDISIGAGGRRLKEFRFDDTPIGNAGVAQKGGFFLGINYGRLARLRPVTGYPQAYDWTKNGKEKNPTNDGVFKVELQTGAKTLLVSFAQLAEALRASRPDIENRELFINHTLWNRQDDRIFFFARADFKASDQRINASFVIRPDGTGLTPMKQHIGGHPEWDEGHRMIGRSGPSQVVFDVDRQEVTSTLGSPGIIPDPEGDIALSPDAQWIVNGYGDQDRNYYVFLRRSDSFFIRTPGLYKNGWISGDLRLDPAPRWNRDGTEILVSAIADDKPKTRQLYLIRLRK